MWFHYYPSGPLREYYFWLRLLLDILLLMLDDRRLWKGVMFILHTLYWKQKAVPWSLSSSDPLPSHLITLCSRTVTDYYGLSGVRHPQTMMHMLFYTLFPHKHTNPRQCFCELRPISRTTREVVVIFPSACIIQYAVAAKTTRFPSAKGLWTVKDASGISCTQI